MTKARDIANIGTALTTVSATELGYLDGTTSAIQTQLNAKQPTVANVSDTEIGYLDGVTSAIQTQIDAKQSTVANVSDTEIGYLDGVTSAIQTQLNSKATTANTVSTAGGSTATASSASVVPITLAGAASQTASLYQVKNSAGEVKEEFTAGSQLVVRGYETEITSSIEVQRYGSTGPVGVLSLKSAGGTIASPTATPTGSRLGLISTQGHDGTNFVNASRITVINDGTITTGSVPSAMFFSTSPAGGSHTERVRIDSAGNVGINTASPATKLDVNGDARFNNQQYAGKNKIINGDFSVFQRTSFTSQTVAAYSLDRWYAGLGGTVTVSQQTTGAPVGSRYCARVAYNSAGSYSNMFQALEAGTVKALAGQTVTASILVRANATWAAISGQSLNLLISKNSTADTLTGGSWGQIASATISAASIPTGTGAADWYKLSTTVAIPNDGTAAGLRFQLAENAVGPSGAYWEMAQAQLEVGSVATPFTTATGTVQGELAACSRYYQRLNVPAGFSDAVSGWQPSTTNALIQIPLTSAMRVTPSIGSTNGWISDTVTFNVAIATIQVLSGSTPDNKLLIANVGWSGAQGAQFRPCTYRSVSGAAAYIELNSEL
jgi:hypothetical protein